MAEQIDPRIAWTPWTLVEVTADDGVKYPALEREGTLGERTVTVTVDVILAAVVSFRGGQAGATDRFRTFLEDESVAFAEALVEAVDRG